MEQQMLKDKAAVIAGANCGMGRTMAELLAGEQPGGAKMLKYSGHFVYFPGPECDPMDQAYACPYLASKMGRTVRGQVIQVCNGAFL